MEFTADSLETAVCQFYKGDSSVQAQAHQYLNSAKCSPQAWAVVWELLQPQKATEVQFYAATTLHTKVEKYLHELSAEEVVTLRGRLLTAVVACSTGPKIVLNRLCIALSSYLLHTCPDRWPNSIHELLTVFTPEQMPHVPANRVVWMLLEILIMIPEEFSGMHFTSHQKRIVRHELEKYCGQIITLVETVLTTQSDQEVIMQAVKCISSWSLIDLKPDMTQNVVNLLVALVFNYHKVHSGIGEKSLEALTAISVHPVSEKYPTYLLSLLEKILTLREIIARELLNPDGADQDMVRNVYSLLITFGETHSHLLLQWLRRGDKAQENVMALVTALLHCSGAQGTYPVDESYSRLAFGFWYNLQDYLAAYDGKEYELCMKHLGPIYRELVDVLMSKAQLPSEERSMTGDDAEDFRCYRQDIGDTLMYCYCILRETTLSLIRNRLQKVHSEETSWQELEACLFGLCSIAENVDLEEVNYLPTLFQYIGQLPFDRLDPKVLATALDTVGAYTGWIADHSASLEHVLPLIPLGLTITEASPNATMALKDLTRYCQTAIKPYSSMILDASRVALHSGRLRQNEAVRLMYSVGRLLSMMPVEPLYSSMEVIVSPYFSQLDNVLQVSTPEAKSNLLTCLKMLGTLIAAIDTRTKIDDPGSQPFSAPHPALLILEKLLPVLKIVSTTWGNDSHVMEAVYALLKQAVTNLRDDSEPAVLAILELIVSSYRDCPEPEALDLARLLCLLFGKEEKCAMVMQSLLAELCSVTLNSVAARGSLSENSDLLEQFFILLSQIVKKIPAMLLFGSNSDCAPLIQCAIMTLGVPELPTVKAAVSFLVNFISQSRDHLTLSNVVNVCGEQLVHKLIALIGGEAARTSIEYLAEILLALNKKYFDNHARWLNQAVSQSLCPRTTAQQREHFVRIVLRERSNKRKLQEQVQEFSLICRGLVRVETERESFLLSPVPVL